MPLPHERALIDAASGRRRERLVAAAAVLDRVRAEHPGIEEIRQLPLEIRAETLHASRFFRPTRGLGGNAVLVVLLVVGLWFSPVRVFRCTGLGERRAECVVQDRMFGVLPVRTQIVSGIADTSTSSYTSTSESHEGMGRTSTSSQVVEELSLLDADKRLLWTASEIRLLGASFDQVSGEVAALISGNRREPIVRIQAVWPILFMCSLCVTFAFSGLASHLGRALYERGLIPELASRIFFSWGGFLLPVALYLVAWALVLVGSDPPGVVDKVLGLAQRGVGPL